MKKFMPVVIAVLVIAAAAGAFVLTRKDNKLVSSNESTKKTTSSSYKVVNACTVVTQAVADAVLGAGAKTSDTTAGDTSSDDIVVSTCSYSQSSSIKTMTLLARSAKTSDGASSNADQFTTGLPATAEKITGYGDSAYWDPTYGQLNILKHNNWYILSVGGLKPSDKSLADAKTFATQIDAKL